MEHFRRHSMVHDFMSRARTQRRIYKCPKAYANSKVTRVRGCKATFNTKFARAMHVRLHHQLLYKQKYASTANCNFPKETSRFVDRVCKAAVKKYQDPVFQNHRIDDINNGRWSMYSENDRIFFEEKKAKPGKIKYVTMETLERIINRVREENARRVIYYGMKRIR